MNVIWIALAGGLGAVTRYLSILGAGRLLGPDFPYGTMFVNVAGSFLMGIAMSLMIDRAGGAHPAAPYVMTGFLGGFTTFSAFSLDLYLLLEGGRFGAAMIYGLASVLVSFVALAAGITLVRMAGS